MFPLGVKYRLRFKIYFFNIFTITTMSNYDNVRLTNCFFRGVFACVCTFH